MTDSLQERVVAVVGDHYQLEGEIGRGGMSVVYKARDLRLKRPVALKVLPPELAHDPAVATRFTREAQTSAHLSHAHIVPIYDVGEGNGIAYFVMGLITGGNLASLLAREPRQPIEEVRRLVWEVADALAYAHLRGVIHRDIKPDNILLDSDTGRAMVTDFGIARAVEANTRLTVTGIAVGTPTYMSPEQAVGEREIDGRADIYSLGVVAYQMLTGRVPFSAGNSMALLLKHVGERPRPIAELRPDVPATLRDAIERALAKEPDDRWPTAGALRDALTSLDAPPSWRADHRAPVRYTSPRPDESRRDRAQRESSREPATVSPRRGSPAAAEGKLNVMMTPRGPIVIEPEHLAGLTPEQRKDIRLWRGRVNLFDRIRVMRGYSLATVASIPLAIVGFTFGVTEAPPFVLSPIVPIFMSITWYKRAKSIRKSGLRVWRVLLALRSRSVIPSPRPSPTERQLAKIASREILDGPHGPAIRRAAEDRAAILDIVATLPKADRALIPDVVPAVNALLERVANLAQMFDRLNKSFDQRLVADLDTRIADAQAIANTPEGQHRLSLLQRQRATAESLIERRSALARQIDNAGLALGNLRLDLIKLRSSGLQSALSDVTSATQEARVLSRDIDAALDAAAEVKNL
jgi:serine/threonine-protein kinase